MKYIDYRIDPSPANHNYAMKESSIRADTYLILTTASQSKYVIKLSICIKLSDNYE